MIKINKQDEIYEMTKKELYEIGMEGFLEGRRETLKIVYEVMKEIYGFGSMRLDKLEKNIIEK